jgi:anti-anti-sigma regulatory factor
MRQVPEERVVIRVQGTFDAAAAQRLSSALEGAAPGEVRVDLSDVREFHDFGIAALAHALADHRHVAVTGLTHHQLRLLRYFGIDAGPVDVGVAVELQ